MDVSALSCSCCHGELLPFCGVSCPLLHLRQRHSHFCLLPLWLHTRGRHEIFRMSHDELREGLLFLVVSALCMPALSFIKSPNALTGAHPPQRDLLFRHVLMTACLPDSVGFVFALICRRTITCRKRCTRRWASPLSTKHSSRLSWLECMSL